MSDAPSSSAFVSSELTRLIVGSLDERSGSSCRSGRTCNAGRWKRPSVRSICERTATASRKLEPSASRRSSATATFVGSLTASRSTPSERKRIGIASYRCARASGSCATAAGSGETESRSTNSSSYCCASAPAITSGAAKPSSITISPRRRPVASLTASACSSCSLVTTPASTRRRPRGIQLRSDAAPSTIALSAPAPPVYRPEITRTHDGRLARGARETGSLRGVAQRSQMSKRMMMMSVRRPPPMYIHPS